MKESRSASQVLFGFLPDQTVDLQKQVWKVREWRHPRIIGNIDHDMLRRELCRVASPWRAQGTDGNYVADLEKLSPIEVLTIDHENGVQLDPFPKIWSCKNCKRIHITPDGNCPCGKATVRASFQFVGYCSACGNLEAPFIPRCPQHREVRVKFPGTATATEIEFSCPVSGCSSGILRRGLGFYKCSCGNGNLSFTVHRASSVYTPRSVVLVNPPSRQRTEVLSQAGGPAQALAWVLDGMQTSTVSLKKPDREALRQQLLGQGIPSDVVDDMVERAQSGGALAGDITKLNLSAHQQSEAEAQAVVIALAALQARITVCDLSAKVSSQSPLAKTYKENYPAALKAAGLEELELNDKFPVLTGQFGYTRGPSDPGTSRLRAFRNRTGTYQVYADLAETEAFFVRLSPLQVIQWLQKRGFSLPPCSTPRAARVEILKASNFPSPGEDFDRSICGHSVFTLIHSYAHRLIRHLAVYAGIERSSLSELILPAHLGFFIYAASRGDFVLGGLQAVFESDLHSMLMSFLIDEHRCPLDPGCARHGSACAACLHLGEPSCRFYNRFLDRDFLFGSAGYLRTG